MLNYSGIGLIGLLGDVNHEYAFPAMRTGILAVERRTRHVSGVSWLDRQWARCRSRVRRCAGHG